MGSAQSQNARLVQDVSVEHKRKVEPLLRANHKHGIILDKSPTEVTLISQSLAAACLLEIQPVSVLFELWDKVAINTIDITDSEEEIVESDYLSPECLGKEDQYTRYVDYFDDEVVRLLYSFTSCTKQYLQVDQVVSGLLARDGWAVRQLAYAVEMGSKDMCTEALAGALSFYKPLSVATTTASVPQNEVDVLSARDEIIEATLNRRHVTISIVSDLVVLNSICVLWQYLPPHQFARLWNHITDKLGSAAAVGSTKEVKADSSTEEHAWSAIVRDVSEHQPKLLPELRLLKDHPKSGLQVARDLLVTS